MDNIVKGGVTWFELALGRSRAGLEVWVKAAPTLEDFMKGLSDGGKSEPTESFGRKWQPTGIGAELRVYNLNHPGYPKGGDYTINKPGDYFDNDLVNLSFLRLVGISDPAGIRFIVTGPYSKMFIKDLSAKIIVETRGLIREYMVPVTINLRISSVEG